MADGTSRAALASQVVLAVLATIGALYLLKPILVPIALAILLACLLSPATGFLRKVFRLGPTSAAVVLFVGLMFLGLYVASLTAESMVQAATTLPSDIQRLAGQMSHRLNDLSREYPYLRSILPDPSTIDVLGNTNAILLSNMGAYVEDLTIWVAQGVIVLILVLFLLAESEMLAPRVIRFFAPHPGDAKTAERTLHHLIRQVRTFLVARTLINLGMGAAIALGLRLLQVDFAVPLGALAALLNFIPYIGSVIGGTLTVLVALSQSTSFGDALIVAAMYLAVVGLEGYVVTPFVMGRSLDLNGTTVLIACLFWGFLWGIIGLFLAMPITAGLKLIFQHIPELHRWAELMSQTWRPPGSEDASEDEPEPTLLPNEAPATVRVAEAREPTSASA